jgi:hypothetical protein
MFLMQFRDQESSRLYTHQDTNIIQDQKVKKATRQVQVEFEKVME